MDDLDKMAAPPPPTPKRGPIPTTCGDCPFAVDGKPERPVRGIGCKEPTWIMVGEGPGREEQVRGEPFVGASGRLMNKAFAAAQVDRNKLWITNATLCIRPGANDATKLAAREACAQRLKDELSNFPGVPILALGSVAAQGFLGAKFSITEMAGALFDADVDDTGARPLIPTLHPAAILRGGAGVAGAHAVDLAYWALLSDVGKVNGLATGRMVRFEDTIDIELLDSRRARLLLDRFVDEAHKAGEFAVDFETVGRDGAPVTRPRETVITAVGLATREWGISLRWSVLDEEMFEILSALLRSRLRKIIHNRLYDCIVAEASGMVITEPIDDTLLMHHSAFPGLAHRLQAVAVQYFAIPPWKAEFRKGEDTDENLARYNARDALVTARLAPPLRRALVQFRACETYAIDSDMARIAARMHSVGVPIDRRTNRELSVKFAAVIKDAREKLQQAIEEKQVDFISNLALERAKTLRKSDPPDYVARIDKRTREAVVEWNKGFEFSASNSSHVAALLRACGVKLYLQTAKGRTCTKRDILEGLAGVPIVASILDFREAEKMASTFVDKLPRYMDENGRIHPIWSVNKITGRWGAVDPQVMNWPKAKKKKNRPNLRAQVRARSRRKLVGFDFAQLEARIIALLSLDPFLCKVFAEGRDLHAELARIVWPKFDQMPVDARKELRDMVKRPEYGAFYEGSLPTLYASVVRDYPSVLMQDIARILSIVKNQMAGVGRWHRELEQIAARDGEIRSAILGRRRCFPLGNAELQTLVNFPVQATGADIMDIALAALDVALDAEVPSADIILQVHDAGVVECDEDDAPRVAEIINRTCAQEHSNGNTTIKFPVDVHSGDTWAEL